MKAKETKKVKVMPASVKKMLDDKKAVCEYIRTGDKKIINDRNIKFASVL